jgi:TolB-like protein/Flp pilus assembly protein TadD
MTLSAGTRLGPYEIRAPLGAGGMGEVYRARDERLNRDVAIKVLPSDVAQDPDRLRRFEHEAQAAGALNHPNITAVYDIGHHEGAPYIVEELLKGETLRERLEAGPLPARKATEYGFQIAQGLAAAHDEGIVHRDLKPENVFVSRDGRIKILDFGLAKLTQPETDAVGTDSVTMTEPGVVMGTVGYMSPEQVRGEAIDHRSDIFSFGAILYEMLSGNRAFGRQAAAETISAIMRDEPPELSASAANISPALDRIVKHCLEKDRKNRFQTAKDVAFNLSEQFSQPGTSGPQAAAQATGKRRIFVSAAIVVLVVVGVLLQRRPPKRLVEAGGVKRVAVLPFENLGSPEDDYFVDGIADAVRGKLTSVPSFEVIARGSSTPYKKTTKTPQEIARELDARYLLTATVRWQKAGGGNRVQVSPELVEVRESGAPASRWQQPFDAALTDVFQVQSDIASRVAQALGVAIGAGEAKRISENSTENLPAYEAFLKGEEASQAALAVDPPSVRKALESYDRAVALDPSFAQAWARVSWANSTLFSMSLPAPELAERARAAAEKAIALAPDRPEGYAALALCLTTGRDFSGALDQVEKGLRVAPGDVNLLSASAEAAESLGRWDAALAHLRQAEGLDPRSVKILNSLGWTLFPLRRYPEALEAFDRGLTLAPANLNLIEGKTITYLAQGDLASARSVLDAARKVVEPTALVVFLSNYYDLVWVLDNEQRELLLRLTPSAFDDNRATWGLCLAQAAALTGNLASVRTYAEKARKAFEGQLRVAPKNPQSHVLLGLALAYLGRKDEAIREGKQGVALGEVSDDAVNGPYVPHQLVRIYILVGEPEKALDRLEPLLKIPYNLSPGWLKIDPNFDPLRNNPRFAKLVAGS